MTDILSSEETQRVINESISEADFLEMVINEAERTGWLVDHVFEQRHYARRTSKGYPDLTMVRGGRLLFAELKSQKGRVRPEQQEWLDALEVVSATTWGDCVEPYLWRPSDMDDIIEILK